jgi:uncharacterized protein (DUF433 family)
VTAHGDDAATTALGDEERAVLRHALRFPRGRYDARRAGQLSGIPERTVYDWAHQGVLVPDFHRATPTRWSYRDLVFLRLLARFRAHGMPRDSAAGRVRLVRGLAAAGGDVDEVRITDRSLLLPGEDHDRLTGEQVLGDLEELTARFDLLAPMPGAEAEHLWGPNLVKPTAMTFISPGVLGGEPCIEGMRIATASVHALVHDRGMSTAQVVVLYPQLTEDGVKESVDLERRMRERKTAA